MHRRLLSLLQLLCGFMGASATKAAAVKAECPASASSSSKGMAGAAIRDAYASFFLTGKGQFWGSAFHVERFIDAVKAAAQSTGAPSNQTLLVDVGAAPYNTMGGDISHVLTFAKHWPASSGASIMAFEPGVFPFRRLVEYVEKQVQRKVQVQSDVESTEADDERTGKHHGKRTGTGAALRETAASVVRDGAREWIVLRNAPLSDHQRTVKISNQPFAGDNTASLEAHYQSRPGAGRTVRSLTLDSELRRRGLASHELLILKVDVEGHEMSVLNGAASAISSGRVPIILVECASPAPGRSTPSGTCPASHGSTSNGRCIARNLC